MSEAVCVAPTSCVLGTAPLWSPSEGYLWWSDVRRAKLHRYNPRTGNTRRYDLPLKVSAMALSQGRLLVVGDGQVGLYDPATEDYQKISSFEASNPAAISNDGGAAPDGSFWFGLSDREGVDPIGAFHRVSPEGKVENLRFDPVAISYTFAFCQKNSVFYTCDSAGQEIFAFDYDVETGILTDRRVLAATIESGCYPDGSALDEDGYLWNAQWAGSRVVRYSPDGAIDRIVKLPVSRPTNCAFGGEDMKTLFVTTARAGLIDAALDRQPFAGCLFAIQTDCPGQVIPEWGQGTERL